MNPLRLNCKLILLALFFHGASQAQVTNYEADGNLEPSHDLDCVGLENISPNNNPPSLYNAARNCVEEGGYENAIELFVTGTTYALYDVRRVRDRTAHQAVGALQRRLFNSMNEGDYEIFHSKVTDFMKSEERTQVLCSKFKSLGHPSYYPNYMIQHGMGAFLEEVPNDLIEIDAETEWNALLAEIGCNKG